MKKIQGLIPKKVENHIKLEELQYCKSVKKWLIERYGREKAIKIWKKTKKHGEVWRGYKYAKYTSKNGKWSFQNDWCEQNVG